MGSRSLLVHQKNGYQNAIASRLIELRSSVVSVLRSLIASRRTTRPSHDQTTFCQPTCSSDNLLSCSSRVGPVLQYLRNRLAFPPGKFPIYSMIKPQKKPWQPLLITLASVQYTNESFAFYQRFPWTGAISMSLNRLFFGCRQSSDIGSLHTIYHTKHGLSFLWFGPQMGKRHMFVRHFSMSYHTSNKIL